MDVTEIGNYQALYQCGVDFEKRRIVAMVGAHLQVQIQCWRLASPGWEHQG